MGIKCQHQRDGGQHENGEVESHAVGSGLAKDVLRQGECDDDADEGESGCDSGATLPPRPPAEDQQSRGGDPGDLSAAMGHIGNPKHPDVQAVIEDAIKRILTCGKAVGILTGDVELAQRYIALGCTFTAVGSDIGLLARGAEQLAAKFVAPA